MKTTIQTRINELFENRPLDKKLMALFVTAGYPDIESTVQMVLGLEKAGADLIELGMPFSDPLADGPTIQYSSNIAIDNGTNLDTVFKAVEEIRKKSNIPLVLMGYLNPVMHYGLEAFFAKAEESGVDGLILPDVPVEESALVTKLAKDHQIDLIYLVAPNTSDERMRLIDSQATGFVYCVSVTGVTGARTGDEVSKSVDRFMGRVNKNITNNPVMVGFGIKTHEDAVKISQNCEGFIVGSALIDNIRLNYPAAGWKDKLYEFAYRLKNG
ncbi:MAG: tryptophan synthase subunit alpha [Balneolales bacterium]